MLEEQPSTPAAPTSEVAADNTNRRTGQRHMTVFQVAKLLTERSQELCLVRNISAGGMMAEVYAPVEVGEHVSIEFKAGEHVSGKVVWARERAIGIAFDDEAPVLDILAHKLALESGIQPRAPRLETPIQARLRAGAVVHYVPVRDISQGGLKVEVPEPLEIDQDVVLTIGDLGQRRGVVRWCQDGHAGISFVPTISYQEFAQWRVRGGN